MHTPQSHEKDNRKFLKHKQRIAIFTALQAAPHLTPVEVRHNIKNFSPSKHIEAAKLSSVRRAVRSARSCMTALEFPECDVPLTDSHGSLASFCESIFLSSAVERHNNDDSEFHLDLHQMVCIAYKTDGGTVAIFDFIVARIDVGDFYRRFPAVHGFLQSLYAS